MNHVKLGRTGLEVSRICLGCMSYGGGNQGNHAWSLGEEESRPFIKRALQAGINFFDTANRYSLGSSEEILGRAIKDFARRDEVVIATKVYGRMRPGPNGAGLSRKAIMVEIDASPPLASLQMEYSLFSRDAEEQGQIDACKELGMTMMAMPCSDVGC